MLVYVGKLPASGIALGSKGAIAVWFVSHGLGFLAGAYLASLLSHLLRSKGQELDAKRGELLGVQDFTQAIIHSIAGGLLRAAGQGRTVSLNGTGGEIVES